MSDGTKIGWCDATVNAWRGCYPVSEGCEHCYGVPAVRRLEMCFPGNPLFSGLVDPFRSASSRGNARAGGFRWTGRLAFDERALLQPLHWRRPRAIFWNSLSDFFHPSAPDDWRDRAFAVMALTPQHTHLVLTKRPEGMRDYLASATCIEGRCDIQNAAVEIFCEASKAELTLPEYAERWPLPNVYLGVTVENRKRWLERADILVELHRAGWHTFVSFEPLLGDLGVMDLSGIDGVIVGGESGPGPACHSLGDGGARPMHPDWARSVRDQCAAAGVPFFFKQWGEWIVPPNSSGYEGRTLSAVERGTPVGLDPEHITVARVGKKLAGRLLDGRTHDDLPWRI